MFLINQAMVNVPIGTAALIVVLGFSPSIFFGLILLMLVTKASGKIVPDRIKKLPRRPQLLLPRPPLLCSTCRESGCYPALPAK